MDAIAHDLVGTAPHRCDVALAVQSTHPFRRVSAWPDIGRIVDDGVSDHST
jgi:hypothetical protein